MSLQAHLEELVSKHRMLDHQIDTAQGQPVADSMKLAELKREKLRLKDKIERIKHELSSTH